MAVYGLERVSLALTVFAPLLQRFIEKALEAEMDAHLDDAERLEGNKRNGRGKKTLKRGHGSFEIATSQDRRSSFERDVVKKRQAILADSLAEKIIGIYGFGM